MRVEVGVEVGVRVGGGGGNKHRVRASLVPREGLGMRLG